MKSYPQKTSHVTCVICLLLVFAGCAPRPSSLPKPVSTALQAPPQTGLSGELERAAAAHPGKSGFAVIPNNRAAFTDRVALADFAQKTLDVQYYIWSADTIGRILGDHVIQAAERGVRVRCLIDDMNLKHPDSALAALAAHPNIAFATNDVGSAQAGYARKRDTLLRGGVELYELRPDAAALTSQVAPHARQARTGVHTQATVIGGEKPFVGS